MTTGNSNSKPFQLDKVDLQKLKTSFILALTGFLAAAVPVLLAGLDTSTAVGGVIAAGVPFLANFIRKLVKDNTGRDVPNFP